MSRLPAHKRCRFLYFIFEHSFQFNVYFRLFNFVSVLFARYSSLLFRLKLLIDLILDEFILLRDNVSKVRLHVAYFLLFSLDCSDVLFLELLTLLDSLLKLLILECFHLSTVHLDVI